MTDKKFDIRQVPNTDPANLLLGDYAFASSPKVAEKEKDEQNLQRRSDDKIFFSYSEGEPVAKVAVVPMMQNVRGKVMPMGGIGGVSSMPSARRGGHIRALMSHSINVMHADGQAVSTLYPFKSSFYERFGYAGWQAPMWARINPSTLVPYITLPKHGSVKQRLSSDAKDELFRFLESTQQRVHGMSTPPRARFDHHTERRPTWFLSVHEGDSITAGISYRLDLEKEVMEVHAVYWHTMNGKLHVLDFMARHMDQVKEIRMPILEREHPHLWVTEDAPVTLLTNEEYSWGAPMGRIVTLTGLAGIPVGDAEATVTVSDPHAPWNEGTWTLSGTHGELSVSKGGTPGGDATIAGLSAMLFSGLDPEILPHRGWGEVNTETAAALQILFPPIVPHLQEQF